VAIRLAHLVVLLTLALGTTPQALAKTDILRTRAGFAAHWVDRSITVGFDPHAPSRTVAPDGARAALEAAVEAWNDVPDLPARFRLVMTQDPAVHVRFCRGKWAGDLDDLGKAVFTADIRTGVVRSAVVEINECDRRFLAPEEAQDGAFDLQAVLTHELGHVLGLAHSDDPNALMFSRGGTAGIRTPKADDRSGIALIYGPPMLGNSEEPPHAYRAPILSLDQAPIEQAVRSFGKMQPAQIMPVLRVAGRSGRAMTVYTSEPTLLPPISTVEPPYFSDKP
jgi:hypothetical protein